ncbi:response regulator [Alysiella crassa]|uniref:Chemotaxis protein CheY n=1 Tax=Alysiella crassa TaxID=153491 RepID=A0A376BMY2_9NEIS|nr:response regulator [Alysiella crassa]SSY70993.1 Chemotaxis protein CheY [Alysiella crassa]
MQRLMIVDDSQIIRNRIQRSMRYHSVEVVAEAADGEEAFELFKRYRPNVITMDLNMPKMGGLEAIKKIMEIDSRVSILVVSAMSDRKTGLRALQSGARGFIQKPFTDEQLVMAINKLITTKVRRG